MSIKPWVIAATSTAGKLVVDRAVVCVAKPSGNQYLGMQIKGLSAQSASIVNLANHGEMAVAKIIGGDAHCEDMMRLVNILPTRIDIDGQVIGEKKGKFLNHFGYRKIVMNFVPDSLSDHAWIACALSYSVGVVKDTKVVFDPKGGSITGGVAGITQIGEIFRGSGIEDLDGIIVNPEQSLAVSLAANGQEEDALVDIVNCSADDFVRHRYYSQLVSILAK